MSHVARRIAFLRLNIARGWRNSDPLARRAGVEGQSHQAHTDRKIVPHQPSILQFEQDAKAAVEPRWRHLKIGRGIVFATKTLRRTRRGDGGEQGGVPSREAGQLEPGSTNCMREGPPFVSSSVMISLVVQTPKKGMRRHENDERPSGDQDPTPFPEGADVVVDVFQHVGSDDGPNRPIRYIELIGGAQYHVDSTALGVGHGTMRDIDPSGGEAALGKGFHQTSPRAADVQNGICPPTRLHQTENRVTAPNAPPVAAFDIVVRGLELLFHGCSAPGIADSAVFRRMDRAGMAVFHDPRSVAAGMIPGSEGR